MVKSKKELKRIDWDIVKRIFHLLYSEGKTKKTHIAMKCKLNYDQTVLYLEWMTLVNFIKKIKDSSFEVISLSDDGRTLYMQKILEAETCLT